MNTTEVRNIHVYHSTQIPRRRMIRTPSKRSVLQICRKIWLWITVHQTLPGTAADLELRRPKCLLLLQLVVSKHASSSISIPDQALHGPSKPQFYVLARKRPTGFVASKVVFASPEHSNAPLRLKKVPAENGGSMPHIPITTK